MGRTWGRLSWMLETESEKMPLIKPNGFGRYLTVNNIL